MLSLVQQFPLIILAIAVVGTLIAFIIGVRMHLSEDKDNEYARGKKESSQAQYTKAWQEYTILNIYLNYAKLSYLQTRTTKHCVRYGLDKKNSHDDSNARQ